jgi:hypothetical protein
MLLLMLQIQNFRWAAGYAEPYLRPREPLNCKPPAISSHLFKLARQLLHRALTFLPSILSILQAQYIVTVPGGEEKLLRSCYLNSLKLALENNCKSIAFPLISSGIYGYPKAEALRIAAAAIQDFLVDHDMDIFLVVFDKKAFVVSEKLLGDVEAFIDEIYVEDYEDSSPLQEITVYEADAVPAGGIDKLVGNLDESFSQTLLRLIKARGMS